MSKSLVFKALRQKSATFTRNLNRFLVLLTLSSFLVEVRLWAAVTTVSQVGAVFSREFKEVVIDLRNSRGGNGDVGAGYLTLMDLLWRYRIQNHITLLVDAEGSKRLNFLLSERYPLPPQVETRTIDTIDKNRKVDFYLALASPSGTLKNKPYENIPFAENAILMVQTVLGNTENKMSINPMGLIEINGLKLNMQPAGIGPEEIGIYNDFIANFLRGRDEDFSRRFVLSELESIDQENTRHQIEMILTKKSLAGTRTGLVYGVTSKDTRGMMTPYLQSLAQRSDESFCLITPSRFDLRFVEDPALRSRIEIFNEESKLPEKAEPGKIYILLTPNLPHPFFVGLTKYAMTQGVTPIGAGDGFMSAGITLGEPFVLTRVPWNARNIENLKQHLLKIGSTSVSPDQQFDTLIKSIYGDIDFTRALELQNYRSIYQKLRLSIPNLNDALLKYALAIKSLSKKGIGAVADARALQSLGLSPKDRPVAQSSSRTEVEKTVDLFMEAVKDNPTIPPVLKEALLSSQSDLHSKSSTQRCHQALQRVL
jgi:hypothetical protein